MWKIVLAAYLAKRGTTATAAIGRTKLRVVEPVEELCAELGAQPLIRTKLGVFEDGEVKVLHPVSAYVRLGTRIGAVAVIVGMREHGSVKPVSQPLIQRAGSLLRRGRSGIAGTAHVRDTGLAEQARAPADDNREAALEGDDGIDAPSAHELVGNSVEVICKLLALAKRKVKNGSEYQVLGNVECIEASLAAEVVNIGVVPANRRSFQPVDFRVGVVDEFGDSVRGEYLRARCVALFHLQLHRMINGIAVIGLGHGHVVKLREGQQQLRCHYCRISPYTPRFHGPGAGGGRSPAAIPLAAGGSPALPVGCIRRA